jgi:hypothetical protein
MRETTSSFNTTANLYSNSVVEDIREKVSLELNAMAEVLSNSVTVPLFSSIYNSLNTFLDESGQLLNAWLINPFISIRTAPGEVAVPVTDNTLRIGVYPVAANPFHWAHLLIGLSALTRYKLDKVVYIIAGEDPRKPALVNAEVRHLAGKKILGLFSPFFEYSSIALGGACDGETNIFRLLALNPEQKLDAYYMVGSDHFKRSSPATGTPDTIQKLEDNMRNKIYGFNEVLHHISVIVIKRGPINQTVDSNLNISFLPEIPFAASSTQIREAFRGSQPFDTLALLPYTAFTCADSFQPSRYFLYLRDSKKRESKSLNPLNFSGEYRT